MMITIWKKRKNHPARADRTALIDVIQTIARDRTKWRKLALRRLHAVTTTKNENFALESVIRELLEEKEALELENAKLTQELEKSLNHVFDWDNLTYHQREQVHYFADVVKGYVNDKH